MSEMFKGAQKYSKPPALPLVEDESGVRDVGRNAPRDEQTRAMRYDAVLQAEQLKQLADEQELARIKKDLAIQAEPTAVFSKVGLEARLADYRSVHLKGDVEEIKSAYTTPTLIESVGTAPTILAPAKVRDVPLDEWLEAEPTSLTRPVANPGLEEKLQRIAREKFGKEFPKVNRPRVTITGMEPQPIPFTTLMRHSAEPPVEEIEDLTEHAEYLEPEDNEPIPLLHGRYPKTAAQLTYEADRNAKLTPEKRALIERAQHELKKQRLMDQPPGDDGFISLV